MVLLYCILKGTDPKFYRLGSTSSMRTWTKTMMAKEIKEWFNVFSLPNSKTLIPQKSQFFDIMLFYYSLLS